MAQREFTQIFPKPGWVEHNPHEIWSSQASVIAEAIAAIDINGLNIAGIGITNQRETTIVWDSETEEPVYNAIVWQDRRTSEYCDRLKAEGQTEFIRERTGLIVDAYFSATKIKWILDNVAGARKRAEKGKLMFGTVDSWLIWRLTRGEVHVTDVSNASRTMLFNIHTLQWDEELLEKARKAGVQMLLFNERDDADKLQALAQELGVETLFWHALHMVPQEQREEGATLLSLLEQTVEALEQHALREEKGA